MLGKTLADLQSNISISAENAVTGTLNWVEGYTGFSSNPAEQSGNYIALRIDAGGLEDATIVATYHGREVTLDSDQIIIVRHAEGEDTITFTASKEGYITGTMTLDLSTLTLTPEPAKFSLVCNTAGVTFTPSGEMAGGMATFEITATGQVPYDTTTSSNLISMTLTTNASPDYDQTNDSILVAYLDSEETTHTLYTGSLTWNDDVGTATFNCPITADSITYSPVIAIVVDGTNATRVSQVLDTSALTLQPQPVEPLITVPERYTEGYVSSWSISPYNQGTEQDPWIINVTLEEHLSSPYGYLLPLSFLNGDGAWTSAIIPTTTNSTYNGFLATGSALSTISGELKCQRFLVTTNLTLATCDLIPITYKNSTLDTEVIKYFKINPTFETSSRTANNAYLEVPPADATVEISGNTYTISDLQTNVVINQNNLTISGHLKKNANLDSYYVVVLAEDTISGLGYRVGQVGTSSLASYPTVSAIITYNGETYLGAAYKMDTAVPTVQYNKFGIVSMGTTATYSTVQQIQRLYNSSWTYETYSNGNNYRTTELNDGNLYVTYTNVDSGTQTIEAGLGTGSCLFDYSPSIETVVDGITEWTVSGTLKKFTRAGSSSSFGSPTQFYTLYGTNGAYFTISQDENGNPMLNGRTAGASTMILNPYDYALMFQINPDSLMKTVQISLDGINWTTWAPTSNQPGTSNYIPMFIKLEAKDGVSTKVNTIYINPNYTNYASNNIIKINIPNSVYT